MNIDNYKDDLIKSLQDLIKIPSVLTNFDESNQYPFGKDINDALEYMINLAKKDGFDATNIDNYAGEITYGNTGKLVGILGHLDVVPVGDGWINNNPFSGEIINNKMYGRGTLDDKGPTICAYYALKMIKDQGIKLKNTIRIILGTDEETGWRGVDYYFKKRPIPDFGFAPDADFPLIYGEKGRKTFDLTAPYDNNDILVSLKGGERYNVVLEEVTALVKEDLSMKFNEYLSSVGLTGNCIKKDNLYELTLKGVASHGAFPEGGKNAGTYMCNFLKNYSSNKMVQWIGNFMHESYYLDKINANYEDYEMGKITCNIGIIDISSNDTRVTLDIRYPIRYPEEKNDQLLMSIMLNGLAITDSTDQEPHYVSPTDPLVTKLYDAYVKNTGDNVNKPFTIGGGTYSKVLPKGVAFGMLFPGDDALEHQCNECVALDTLFKATKIYYDAILALGEIDA